VRYAFIEDHVQEYPVRLMCNILEVSPSGYYDWRDRAPSPRARRHAALSVQVQGAFHESRQTYGSPRITRELCASGVKACRNTVAKVMQEAGLMGRMPRRFVPKTTDSAHAHPIAPNTLDRQFAPGGDTAAWISDITYIPTAQGWLYLAGVMDLASRRIVGWAMADHMRAELVLDALQMALLRKRPGEGLLHHSDRGVQYACGEYRKTLEAHGITCSMSRTGNCYDNAVMESFWATLKVEAVYRQEYVTHEQAHADIFDYIEVFYNRQRRHSALGYLSPEAFEAGFN
jgi:transposase InsO family protein